MQLNYVYTGAAAAALMRSPSWVRHAIHSKVCDCDRYGPRGWYEIDLSQMLELVIASRMRELHIGYPTIRDVIDKVSFDGEDLVVVSFGTIIVSVDKKRAITEARAALKVANHLQYGTSMRNAPVDHTAAKAVELEHLDA